MMLTRNLSNNGNKYLPNHIRTTNFRASKTLQIQNPDSPQGSPVSSATKPRSSILSSFKRLRNLAQSPSGAGGTRPKAPFGTAQVSPHSNNHVSAKMKKFRKSQVYQRFKKFQKQIYVMLEDPQSSIQARVVFIITIAGILFSVVSTYIESIMDSENTPRSMDVIEMMISILFVTEYALRIFASTAFDEPFFKYMLKPYNVIDFFSLIPFWIDITTDNISGLRSLRVLRVVRIVRIIRVFKLSRYMKGTSTFMDGVKNSLSSLGFLLMFFVVLDIVFATALFYAEKGSTWEAAHFSEDQEQEVHNL